MKKLLLSRRGAAIEMAIGVMLLMIAVSIVLLTLSTIKHDRKEDDVAQLENRIEEMQVTDSIIEGNELPTGYSYETEMVTENEIEYTLYKVYKNDELVFSFKVNGEDVITSWK